MVLTGKQKAALLLTSLDKATAEELLKSVDATTLQDLAVELTYLDAEGHCNDDNSLETVREFCSGLYVPNNFQVKDFLSELLNSTVGQEKADFIQSQIDTLLKKRDPFMQIRAASEDLLVEILKDQHPQVIASVLSELNPKKSSLILNALPEELSGQSISRMAVKDMITPEARTRIAEMICRRIESAQSEEEDGAATGGSDSSYRKIAVIIRNLERDIREGMLESIADKDSEAPDQINKLMVLWEDFPILEDRSLQLGLRGIDSQKLAIALFNAEPEIEEKIRANISERASATIDEERELMSDPKPAEIDQAREELLNALRDMNKKGELGFIDE